jgi:signal transduction histidine kinase
MPPIFRHASIGLQLLLIFDAQGNSEISQVPAYTQLNALERNKLAQCLDDALHGQQSFGHMQDSYINTNFTGSYACLPLKADGNIVGAMFYAEPTTYPQGLSSNDFLVNISRNVLIISAAIALIIIFCSLLFAKKLAQPLVILQRGVDRISAGDYTERIALPERRDEVGQLILSFNRMASQIETNIQELQQQERNRRELMTNIAHDLYTPLATIQGFNEALADGVIVDEPARIDAYQTIVHEVQRMERLVKKVQQLSSLEAGQTHLDLAPLNIAELIASILEMVGYEYEEVSITLHQQLQPDSIVLADSDSIVQIVLNLLDNAKRYTLANGSVTVGCRIEGTMTRVWIQNTGSGIDAHDLPRIFDRFYRADPSRTLATGGNGLGLAIVKSLIERHGGTIWAESTPEQGTVITFTLRNASTNPS